MLHKPLRLLLLTMLVFTSGLLPTASFATAQNPPPSTSAVSAADQELDKIHQSIKRCANLRELSIRLGCYDDYATDLGYITPDRAQADAQKFANIGMWQISKTNDGQGLVHTQLRLDSLNKLPTRKGIDRHVSLVIRCVPGKTEAMIDWKAPVTPIAAATRVLANYNTENTEKMIENWDISTDRQALFAPDAIAFGRYLINKKRLIFSFGFSGSSTSNTARFNIEGIETALDEVVKDCYSDTSQEIQ